METKHPRAATGAIVLFLSLPIAYILGYLLALRPVEITMVGVDDLPTYNGFYRREAYYFSDDLPRTRLCLIGDVLFRPLHTLDRKWRPDFWDSKEAQAEDAWMQTLPVDAAGNRVIDLRFTQ